MFYFWDPRLFPGVKFYWKALYFCQYPVEISIFKADSFIKNFINICLFFFVILWISQNFPHFFQWHFCIIIWVISLFSFTFQFFFVQWFFLLFRFFFRSFLWLKFLPKILGQFLRFEFSPKIWPIFSVEIITENLADFRGWNFHRKFRQFLQLRLLSTIWPIFAVRILTENFANFCGWDYYRKFFGLLQLRNLPKIWPIFAIGIFTENFANFCG